MAKQIEKARVYVSATFNNTLVTVTDEAGHTLAWGSAGKSGFKGTRKSTPFAATTVVDQIMAKVKAENGVGEVDVYVNGPGPGRESSLRAIKASGMKIAMITDLTPMPHDGPRPKKKRRN